MFYSKSLSILNVIVIGKYSKLKHGILIFYNFSPMAIIEDRQVFLGDIVCLQGGQSYAKVVKFMKEVYIQEDNRTAGGENKRN